MKLLVLLVLLAQTADPVTQSRKLYGEALEAYRAKNATLFLEKVRAAAALRPKHPTLQYQLAVAQAMNGANDEALSILERVAAMGFVYDPKKQPELAALSSLPRFNAIVERFAANARPIGDPDAAFTLDEKGIIGEGLAFDAKRERFFVSGVHAHKVFAIDRDGHASTFATLERGGFGMAVDAKRGALWVATSSLPQMEGFRESDAALVKLDLRTGKTLATLRPDDKEKHLFGDVTLAANGEVFVSDGESPVIFHVEGDKLTPFARGAFGSLQGLAATSRYLYVSDYSNGLYTIGRKSREIIALDTPDSVSLLGVDGIYLTNDQTLIAVQNGTNPTRVLRIALSADGLGITSVATLAANHESMSDVTLGTFAHDKFHFIGNGGWEAWNDEGKRNEKVPLEAVHVLSIHTAHAQNSDPNFDAMVATPAFDGNGPKILFDDAHQNFHRSNGRYAPFVTLVRNDGCVVTSNTKPFDRASLAPYDVLAIVNADGDPAFTKEEIEAVGAWVESGKSLLLIADHSPFGRAANAMSERFGVSMLDHHLKDDTHHDPSLPGPYLLLFTRENGLLADHPITRGINRIVTFGGQALRVHSDAEPLLKLSPDARIVKDPKHPSDSEPAGADAAHAVALKRGKGRVVIIGEAAALTAQVITGDAAKPFGAEELRFGISRTDIDNKQFALNIVRWLAGKL